MKRYAEINGKLWEANYPFCAGCPELILGGSCGYDGNGCRFPAERTKMPISFHMALLKVAKKSRKTSEALCAELGDCLLLDGDE